MAFVSMTYLFVLFSVFKVIYQSSVQSTVLQRHASFFPPNPSVIDQTDHVKIILVNDILMHESSIRRHVLCQLMVCICSVFVWLMTFGGIFHPSPCPVSFGGMTHTAVSPFVMDRMGYFMFDQWPLEAWLIPPSFPSSLIDVTSVYNCFILCQSFSTSRRYYWPSRLCYSSNVFLGFVRSMAFGGLTHFSSLSLIKQNPLRICSVIGIQRHVSFLHPVLY